MTEAEQTYKRNENFVFRQIDNETILVPIKDNVGDMNCIYNLNEVGAFIWQNIKCKHSVTEGESRRQSDSWTPAGRDESVTRCPAINYLTNPMENTEKNNTRSQRLQESNWMPGPPFGGSAKQPVPADRVRTDVRFSVRPAMLPGPDYYPWPKALM